MNKNLLTIEDCLEIIAGLTLNYKIDVDKDDRTIVYSIARQVFKGNALTDRQQALMQVKLLAYKQQFTDLGFTNFEESLQNLRMPLRQIDRRKYVKIVDEADADNAKNYKGKWIKIRFPFFSQTYRIPVQYKYMTSTAVCCPLTSMFCMFGAAAARRPPPC